MDTPVTGSPLVLLRAEGLAVLVASVAGYATLDGSWTTFALILLAPDLSLFGYLAGPRVGAHVYNAAHTYLAPAALALLACSGTAPEAWPLCLIWTTHIGMDRVLGLGLKFPTAFRHTHLGTVGRG